MLTKEFIRADALLSDSFALARKIYDSGYRPDAMIVIWRGGTPVGIAIHEFFLYKGVETYHTVVKAQSYTGIEKRVEPHVEHLDVVLNEIKKDSRVLLIDDIFDSGCTMKKIKSVLAAKTVKVKIATLYCKKSNNMTDITPDFFLRQTDDWIVFPHELVGLSPEEIRCKGVDIAVNMG